MKKFFIKLAVLFAIIWAIFFGLDKRFDKKALQDPCRRSNWVFSHKNQQYDFVFCGSSRAYDMVDIKEIEKLTGKSGLNVSYSGTGFEEQYLILGKMFQNGNKIKQLFLQADIASLNSESMFNYAFHDYNYIAYLNTDTFIARIVKDNSNPLKYWLWKNLPFVKYAEFNLEYPVSFLFKDFSDCKAEFDDKGSHLLSGTSPQFLRAAEDYDPEKLRLSESNMESYISKKTYRYFKDILKLCRENGTEIILYTPPIFVSIVGDKKNQDDYRNIMQKIADENEVIYLCFVSDPICFDKANFFDAAHLNSHGSELFSKEIAQYIK